MNIEPVAYFRSPVSGKFGIPRQSGLVPELKGSIVLEDGYRRQEAIRGLEGFSHIWLIWGFSLNDSGRQALTVRPPRLGGNERVGVFASRSPFRPNGMGLSSVRIESIDSADGIIQVAGADLADGTPIYDIKPYVRYTDCHEDAVCGFVDSNGWQTLAVEIPDGILSAYGLSAEEEEALRGILAQDPRPQYQDDPDKIYGLTFAGRNIRFRVISSKLTVIG